MGGKKKSSPIKWGEGRFCPTGRGAFVGHMGPYYRKGPAHEVWYSAVQCGAAQLHSSSHWLAMGPVQDSL